MIDAKRRAELDAAIELIHFSYRQLVVHPDRVLAARGLARAHHRVLYFVAKLGAPAVSVEQMIRWTAHWIRAGGPTLNKPTHFEARDGRF